MPRFSLAHRITYRSMPLCAIAVLTAGYIAATMLPPRARAAIFFDLPTIEPAVPVATSASLSAPDSPAATLGPDCPGLAPLLMRCQPPNLSGVIWCGDACEDSAGTRCKVSLVIHEFAGDHPPVLPLPFRAIDGSWLVWSARENRRYYIFNGSQTVFSGADFEYTLCERHCGLRLEGFAWVELDDHDAWPIEGKGLVSARTDCAEPTPALPFPPDKMPQRCLWQSYLPLAHALGTGGNSGHPYRGDHATDTKAR